MINDHLKKVRQRADISADEERAIREIVAEVRHVGADESLVREGDRVNVSLLLCEGWLSRCKDLPSGDRQMTELHVAGDFADLHAYTLKKLDHEVRTLTPCTLAIVPHERLDALFEKFPRLGKIYWFLTNIDAAVHREQILSLGRRSALARMAHLFCELNVRLGIVGRSQDNRFDFPLTQRELSEYLGLTVVHVNRMLQELRRRQLVELSHREVVILDHAELKNLAEFETTYLFLEKRPF